MALPSKLSALHKRLRESLSDLDARLIIQNRAGLDHAAIIANPDKIIGAETLAQIESDMAKRIGGMPLSRLYGTGSFWGLDFCLSPATLDPRLDTETIIEAALKLPVKPKAILDLGTGSGCILITLLREFPAATGVGVDIAPGAIETAKENAALHGVADRASFICGGWSAARGQNKFDLIVSNPPYIERAEIQNLESEVRNHDPILALDGGEDGLEAYRAIFTEIKNLLSPGGTALLEIGFDQSAAIMRLARDSGFRVKTFHTDSGGHQRVVEISCGDK